MRSMWCDRTRGASAASSMISCSPRALVRARFLLFDAPSVPAEEMERAFAPFASVQYEGGSAIRNAVVRA